MKKLLHIQALAFLALASAQLRADDSDEIFNLATDLSKCVGFYNFMSGFSKSQGDNAAAEHMHNMANGAKTSAAYSLSIQYAADNPNKSPKKFTDFYGFVDGRSETVYTHLMASYEAGQTDPMKELSVSCTALAEVQEGILNMMRKELYLPKSN